MKKFSTILQQLVKCSIVFFCLAGCAHHTSQIHESSAVITQHHTLVQGLLQQSVGEAENLVHAINQFRKQTNQTNLEQVKGAWSTAKNMYSLLEATRFSGHAIDEVDTLINAWPIDEVYIDYAGGQNRGIIATPDIEITGQNLLHLNEQQGETNISIGFHAIEFLLWGQDNNVNGPGNRPLTDFTSGPLAERRKQYLFETATLLLFHLDKLSNDWMNTTLNSSQLPDIITGLGTFIKAELVGERIQVALDTFDQEDEQSCFSDLTNQDIIQNIKGVKSLLTGIPPTAKSQSTHTSVGLIHLFSKQQSPLTDQMMSNINSSLQLMQSLNMSFDQAILPTNPESRDKLTRVTELMNDVANDLRTLQYQKYGQ